jgi:type I restriction enzyme S subunit
MHMTSFIELSASPSACILAPESVTIDRFDSSFYLPHYLRDRDRLEALPFEIRDFREVCSPLNCGATPKRVIYADTGLPLIRTSNIRPNLYDASDVQRVAGRKLSASNNLAVLPGDILYTMSGTVGYTAVYPEGLELASCSNTIARARVKDRKAHDPHYIAVFLNSSLGMSQSLRLVSGGILGHVMPNFVKRLRIVLPKPEVQHSVGVKVQAAGRLRANGATAQGTIHAWLSTCLPAWGEPGEQLDVVPIFDQTFTSERLDPWYNHLQFQQLEQALAATHSLVPLSSLGTLVTERWSGTTGEIEYIEIGEFDLSQGTAHGKVISAAGAPSRAQIAARPGDLAVSLVRPNRKNIVFIQGSGGRQIVVTSGCDVLRFADEDTAALYSVVLRHNAITHQIMRWNTGTSYPAIEQLRADRVLVPSIPEDKKEELLNAARLAVTGVERAKSLIQSAISDVEKLIEGKLDEAACLAEGRKLAAEFGLEVP